MCIIYNIVSQNISQKDRDQKSKAHFLFSFFFENSNAHFQNYIIFIVYLYEELPATHSQEVRRCSYQPLPRSLSCQLAGWWSRSRAIGNTKKCLWCASISMVPASSSDLVPLACTCVVFGAHMRVDMAWIRWWPIRSKFSTMPPGSNLRLPIQRWTAPAGFSLSAFPRRTTCRRQSSPRVGICTGILCA